MQHYFPSFTSQNSRETLANRARFASVIIALSLAFCRDAFAQIIATYKETYRRTSISRPQSTGAHELGLNRRCSVLYWPV